MVFVRRVEASGGWEEGPLPPTVPLLRLGLVSTPVMFSTSWQPCMPYMDLSVTRCGWRRQFICL